MRFIRVPLCFAACVFLFCATANAQSDFVEAKQYSFSLMNGKVLPIPGDLPGVCQANVSGWPFAGFAFGGIYLPPLSFPMPETVTIQGEGQILQFPFGPVCVDNGYTLTVNYCISTDTTPCPRPKAKFHIKNNGGGIGMGVRG